MRHPFLQMRRATLPLASAWLVSLCATFVHGQSIDVSLNVFYNDPSDRTSGGMWQAAAKSDLYGINGLELLLSGIATASPAGPTGEVNGGDPAGFSEFVSVADPGGFRYVILGQDPIGVGNLDPGDEETVFYGVGTLQNGSPDFIDAPMGSNSIGPTFTSLTNTDGLPWATGDVFGDAAWDTAAILATGSFAPESTPGFYSDGNNRSSGNVFMTIGTSTAIGDQVLVDPISTTIRNNYLPDYNHNGLVDAADYTVWRDTLGMVGIGLDADGDNSGEIDEPDFLLWRQFFGTVVPGAGAGGGGGSGLAAAVGSTVPEPASWVLWFVCGIGLFSGRFFTFCARPARLFRNVRVG